MFADLEQAIARHGIAGSDDMQLWEIACALGVHRTTVSIPGLPASLAPAVAEMLENERIYQETGVLPDWGPESGAEQAQNARLW